MKLRDKNGWTPLHCAASQQHLDICDLLLKKGASPNAQNGSFTSPFAYAVRYVCCEGKKRERGERGRREREDRGDINLCGTG